MNDMEKLHLATTLAPLAVADYEMRVLFRRLMEDLFPPTPHHAEGPPAGSAGGDGVSPQASAGA